MREFAIGAAIGGVIFLMYMGVNIYPALFLAGIALVLMQTGTLRAIGTRKNTVGNATGPAPVTFNDIGGQNSAKRELLEALDFIAKHDTVKHFGIRPLKGILLTGPPGTGKTLLAKAAAHYCDSAFLAASGSEFIEMYAGVGAQRVRQLFKRARDLARQQRKDSALIFIDEIEVVGGRRGSHQSHLEYDQTLNELLVQMDGIQPDEDVRVLLVAATNRVDMLDPALMRPGRFDRVVNVDLPDKEGRLAILALHARNKPIDENVDWDAIARGTFGFSGAHLESLCNEAAILAMREGAEKIQQKHLMEAIDKVIMGERLDRRPNPSELERVAIHEAGHAIAGELVQPGSVASITVSPRGNALGYVRTAPEDDRHLYTRPQMEDQICVLLAGSMAEDIVYGDRSTGAANDFDKALGLARRIIDAGLSSLGVVDASNVPQADLLAASREIIQAQEQRVRAMLEGRRALLDEVARILREEEVLDGDRFRALLANHPAPEPTGGDTADSQTGSSQAA